MRFDRDQLVALATQNIQTANAVRQDPPVVKAFHEFKDDAARAVKSGTVFAGEVRESWRRHNLNVA